MRLPHFGGFWKQLGPAWLDRHVLRERPMRWQQLGDGGLRGLGDGDFGRERRIGEGRRGGGDVGKRRGLDVGSGWSVGRSGLRRKQTGLRDLLRFELRSFDQNTGFFQQNILTEIHKTIDFGVSILHSNPLRSLTESAKIDFRSFKGFHSSLAASDGLSFISFW